MDTRRTPLIGLIVAVLAALCSFGPAPAAGAAPGDPHLSFGPLQQIAEGPSGTTTTVTLTATMDGARSTPVSWRWVTFYQPDWIDPDIRPSYPGQDYVDANGTITFAPGETSKEITVIVLGDDLHEFTELLIVVAVIDREPIDTGTLAIGNIHIVNDDAAPQVIPGIGWVSEADGPGAVLHVQVTLSRPTGMDVTVDWTTLNVPGAPAGQALAPDDHTTSAGTVWFSATIGETTRVVDIPINDDDLVEGDEYVVVSFTHPSGATMGGFWGLGFGGIHDDD